MKQPAKLPAVLFLVLAGCAADPHLSDPNWIFNGPNFCITNREPIMIKELCYD